MKRSIILVLLIIASYNLSWAQAKMDSLWTVWSDTSLPDTSRVDALCDFANEYSQTNIDSSLYYAEMAYDFATRNELSEFRSRSKTIVAVALKRKGQHSEALTAHNEAIAISRARGDSAAVGSSLNNIGALYYSKGEYDLALDYYSRSRVLMKDSQNKYDLAGLVNNIGIIHIIQNNYDQAIIELEEAVELYAESNSPEERTGPMNNMAILKTRQGDYAGAIELYTRSLAIDEQAGNEFNAGYTFMNIANLYYNQGDHPMFYENAYKSLEIREKLNNKRGIVTCLSNIGAVLLEDNELDEALKVLTKCLPIAEELDLKNYVAHIVLTIGSVHIENSEYDLAIDRINRAFSTYREVGDDLGIAKCYKVLGYYYKETGDNRRAISSLNKSLDLANGLDITLTEEVAQYLYEVYSEEGNSALALVNYELYIASRDSIASEENKSEIIRQEYKYEYDKKALADSISFVNQREIQQAKLDKTASQQRALMIILAVVFVFSVILFGRIRLINKQKTTIEEQNEELNSLNENLEQKVEERTQEVLEINDSLIKSDERYTYALEASNDGIWDYNVKEDSISFSPAIFTMLGYEPNEFPESRQGIYDLLHSDELKADKRRAHDLFITRNDEDFLFDEYRLKGKDGRLVWIQVKGKIVEKDNNNMAIRIVGTHTDITADKLKNQEMLETVLRTEDTERKRIAKDIHDGIQQTLTTSLFNFQSLKKDLKDLGPKALEKFELGSKYLKNSINESRSVAHALMPKAIVDFGILSAFESTIYDIDNSQEQTEYHFSHNLESGRLSNQQIEITLFRILQEALNNINKYARASTVHVQLKEYEDIFMLTIEDDGQGFDVEEMHKKGSGLGFKSMQNRLDAINGFLEINSVPGKGTEILVEINKGPV